MPTDPNAPVPLTSVVKNHEADTIIAALADHGIQAMATGGFSAEFRGEAPSMIKIVMKHSDLERANRALAEIHEEDTEIDWSRVDVGQPEEE